MTREEYIDFANALKNNYTIDFDKLPEFCDMAISALSENKGEWIPVSKRLPEERQSVLVWCPQYKNIYCACLEKEQWWIFGAFVQIVPNEVVAWMPLPEPYKAEKPETCKGRK